MALNFRDPSSGGESAPATSYPISRSFAFTVLLALVALWALRHVFGSISVNAGSR